MNAAAWLRGFRMRSTQMSLRLGLLLLSGVVHAQAITVVRIVQPTTMSIDGGASVPLPVGALVEKTGQVKGQKIEVRLNAAQQGFLPENASFVTVSSPQRAIAPINNPWPVAPGLTPIPKVGGPNPWQRAIEDFLKANPAAKGQFLDLLKRQSIDMKDLSPQPPEKP
jgi:hypothetical protein